MDTPTNGTSEVEIKLTTSGRYVWRISSVFSTERSRDAVQTIKQIDNHLKDLFPDFAKRGTGRTVELED